MELDLVCFTAGQQIFENLLLRIGQAAIQQAGGGFVKQLPASDDDVQRHGDRNQGVENRQAGELHQAAAQLLQRLGLLQAADGGMHDGETCHHDQHTFQAAREVFGLELAVRVAADQPACRWGDGRRFPIGSALGLLRR
jgi:hypothetical protein